MRSRAPIDRAKAEGLAREGMLVAGGIHEVAARAEVVLTCLASVVALQQ